MYSKGDPCIENVTQLVSLVPYKNMVYFLPYIINYEITKLSKLTTLKLHIEILN
jgi:hypothetical protein